MDNKYLTRSNFSESVAVDNFMKTRLDKMVVIQVETRQRMKSGKVKAGWLHETNQTDSSS